MAAPRAVPTIACSEIGVSRTRDAPNRSNKPAVDLKTPPGCSDVLADQHDPGVRLELVGERPSDGLAIVDLCRHA